MSHSHSEPRVDSASMELRQRRALRLMMLCLIPIAVWTLGAMIMMWPRHIADHVRDESSQWAATGVTVVGGTITSLSEMSCEGVIGSSTGDDSRCARAEIRVDEGPDTGTTVEIQLTSAHYSSGVKPGQQVNLFRVPVEGAEAAYSFSDFARGSPMLVFALLFVASVVLVARWRGLRALIGLVFAGFIIVRFLLPALIEGRSPVLVGIVAGSAIMFVVLYTTHGFSARTTTALIGTLFGLALTALLGWVGVRWTHLTGVASEDDFTLASMAPDMRLTSVVIAGVIVAGLGVLNDATITQASAVWELAEHESNPRRLFTQAMRIGRDHVASTVYTIAFASAGAVLSVLLLIAIYQRPLLEVIVTEQFAGEVMRTLVGSIGLVLSMPLTTAIAVAVVGNSAREATDALAPTAGPRVDDNLVNLGDARDESLYQRPSDDSSP